MGGRMTRADLRRGLVDRGVDLPRARKLIIGTNAEPRVHLPANSFELRQIRELGFSVNFDTGALIALPGAR